MLLNDPFAGGTHLNDLTMVSPVFAGATGDGPLVGWVANRAHHADVGGSAPGSMPPDALTVDEEGLRLPPTPIDDAVLGPGRRRVAHARASGGATSTRSGAPTCSASPGCAELVRVLDGTERFDEVLDYGERRMRAALDALPDGRWQFTDVLDSAGPRPQQQTPTRIVLTLTVAGDEVTFDFTGTDDQRPGNVNAVEAVTVSAVAFAIRSATDPSLPANGGAMRPVRIVAPAGSVVAAQPPVAVGAGNVEVSQRVADVCLGALAQAVPGRIGAASQGTMNNVLLGGDGWVHYETLGGGQGARPWADGMSGVHTAMTNTLDTPVEAMERALPVRVRRYGLRRGSGGAGAHAGGDGIVRELEALAPITVSLVTERRVSRPWGLDGGAPGAAGRELAAARRRRARRPPPARQVHRDARARRRAARAHSGRRRLGTARLTAATTVGRGGADPGREPGERVGDGRHVAWHAPRCDAVRRSFGGAGPPRTPGRGSAPDRGSTRRGGGAG